MWVEKHGPTYRIRDRVGDKKVTVADGYLNKTAAKTALKALAGDQVRGDLVMPSAGEKLLGDWARDWWEARKSGLSPNTQRSEWSRIQTHILPALGDQAVGDIRPLHVQRWVSEMGKTRSAKTVANVHGVLNSIMAGAVAQRLIRANPCAGTKLPRGMAAEMRFLTEPEAGRLLLALPEHYRPLFVTALGTGLRWGELAGLRAGRVDVLAGILRVEETLSELPGAAELVFGPPKTAASRRTVTLPSEVRQALVGLVANLGPGDLVFRTSTGQPLRIRNFRRIWLAATERAGVAGLRFHDLRHSHVAWLLSAPEPPNLTAIQRRLGHASITVTSDRYGHLLPAVDERIATALDAALPRSDWGQGGGTEPTMTHDDPRQATAVSTADAVSDP
ncbi:site-specific integrase [Micromonospora sp. NBRC 101691]|uniref:tyrosine-type recombinase/integrase n=1 Tax=Micromonospora sp. NBRC 101691 TaxID=3032198 RepID=UPI0024A1628A|nr:site-specific integrase [Micromonospora sp. NBRC 101691]GLY21652.1 site-specific integrase [Micromonospora sp. NBRC 101691]